MSTKLRFRFVGGETQIGNVQLSIFGQLVELDPSVAHDCILGHVGLVPESQFDEIGFTDEQLRIYAHPSDMGRLAYDRGKVVDTDFISKLQKVHKATADYRVKYEQEVAEGSTFMTRDTVPAVTTAIVSPGKYRKLEPVIDPPVTDNPLNSGN